VGGGAWTNDESKMISKKFVFLSPGTWKVNFSWGDMDDFDGIVALKRGAVAFDKCFGVKRRSVKQ
jgi:hypothetical protein